MLGHVDARAGGIQAMEQHGLLHGREPIDPLDVVGLRDVVGLHGDHPAFAPRLPMRAISLSRSFLLTFEPAKSAGVKPAATGVRLLSIKARSATTKRSARASIV